MKKKNKESHSLKNILLSLLEVLCEIALYAFCAAVGFGVCYIVGGDALADMIAESEAVVVLGLAIILLIFLIAGLMAVYIKKLLRFLVKKVKNKHM